MFKQQWLLLDSWAVENKQRVLFKDLGPHLVDITMAHRDIEGIITEVESGTWTTEELIDYLNEKGNAD